MRKFTVLLILGFLLAVCVQADIYIKENRHTGSFSMMGKTQPARDEVTEMYFGEGKAAFVTKADTKVIDYQKKLMTVINHSKKTYMEMQLPVDLAKYFPPEMAPMMKGMMDSMKVTVVPNGQSKMVGQWSADGYDVTMEMSMMGMAMKTDMKIWASKDVPFDWKKYASSMAEVAQVQMRLNTESMDQLRKIVGQWVATESSLDMMGAKIQVTSQVEIIDGNRTPPAGLYAVPAGYTKKEFFSPDEMRN